MKSLSKYIKEKDTDTRLVEEMDDLVYNLIQNDDMYESMGGKSQTTVEAIGKFKDTLLMILQAIAGGEGFSGGTSLVEKEYRITPVNGGDDYFIGYLTEIGYSKLVHVPRMSPNGITLDMNEVDKGRYLLFTHNSYVMGNLVCTYEYYTDDHSNKSDIKGGILQFDGTSQNVYLITDEELPDNATVFIEASGILEEMALG